MAALISAAQGYSALQYQLLAKLITELTIGTELLAAQAARTLVLSATADSNIFLAAQAARIAL